MLGFGLIWAIVRGWQLTLVGIAIVPIFGFVMALVTKKIRQCESRNKVARVEVAKKYYEVRCHSDSNFSFVLTIVLKGYLQHTGHSFYAP